jgi:outer membrane receptor protein involved in Fe transport
MALATAPIAKDFRWAASATFNRESAVVGTSNGDRSEGAITITELAVDGQFERKWLRSDLAVGVAIPLDADGAKPWPEAKLATKVKPHRDLELTGTVAYKGRVPALRERFDATIGNPALGAELARHAELRVVWETMRSAALGTAEHPEPRLRLTLAPYVKKTTGSSRICLVQEQCPDDTLGRLAALDATFFYGVDTQARVRVARSVELGGSYGYVKVCELGSAEGCDVPAAMMGGADPLDRLPRHRADAWVQVMPHAKLAALARARYFGGTIDRGERTAGYALVEASLTAQVTKQYLGVLRVDDALDERPETRDGFRAPGRVISIVVQGTWE